jgi:hypothetical protein
MTIAPRGYGAIFGFTFYNMKPRFNPEVGSEQIILIHFAGESFGVFLRKPGIVRTFIHFYLMKNSTIKKT